MVLGQKISCFYTSQSDMGDWCLTLKEKDDTETPVTGDSDKLTKVFNLASKHLIDGNQLIEMQNFPTNKSLSIYLGAVKEKLSKLLIGHIKKRRLDFCGVGWSAQGGGYPLCTVDPRYAVYTVSVKWKRYSLMMMVEIPKGDVEHTQPTKLLT